MNLKIKALHDKKARFKGDCWFISPSAWMAADWPSAQLYLFCGISKTAGNHSISSTRFC